MCFRVKMFRLESHLPYICYIWSAWTLILTTAECTNLTLDCTNSITLTSPNYPSNYPNGAVNEWYIRAHLQRRILVTFNDFSLEDVDDTIVIKDLVNSLNKKRYTGENMNSPPFPFLTQGYSLHIKFTSSEEISRRGFNISLTCYNTSNTVAKLVDGHSPSEGFLQLSSEFGERVRVCEESLSPTVAEIICRELGYPGDNEISYFNDSCLLEGHCTRAPSCQDNQPIYRTVDCAPGQPICSSNTSVKVKCFEVGYEGCYDFGNMELGAGSRFKSKEQCISSCSQENNKPIAIMNHTDCFCSTADKIKDMQRRPVTSCTGKPELKSRMSVYSASIGFCEELNDMTGGSWDSNITWFGSIVHRTCMEGYSLKGNGTLQCVPGLTPYYAIWNDSIPDCITDYATTGFTTELADSSPSTESKSTTNISEITTEYTATSFSTSTDVHDNGNTMDPVDMGITVAIALLVLIIIIIGVCIYYKHEGNCQSCYSTGCNAKNRGKGDSGKDRGRQMTHSQLQPTIEEEQSLQILQDPPMAQPVPLETTPL